MGCWTSGRGLPSAAGITLYIPEAVPGATGLRANSTKSTAITITSAVGPCTEAGAPGSRPCRWKLHGSCCGTWPPCAYWLLCCGARQTLAACQGAV
jgi:hypothetical protein